MRILYLTQWFEPEPMIKGATFVTALRNRGHDVQVVTGFPNYPTGKLYPGYRVRPHCRELIHGCEIDRVAIYPSHDRSSLGRIINYVSYALSATLFGIFCARRFDVIYAYPPITVGLAAALIGAVRRRPFVLDVQDLWPDSVTASGMTGAKRLESAIAALCKLVYGRASRIVTQSHGISSRLVERGVPPAKLMTIYNWADEDAAAPAKMLNLAPYGFGGRFNIIYGGNLGRVQGLDALLRAAALASREVPTLKLTLIGDGVEADRLRALAAELCPDHAQVMPGIPRNQIGDVFDAADVLTLHLLDDPLFEITIPQKTQFYLAMGKPVLIGVKGEAEQFVTDAQAGLAAHPCDVSALAQAMIRLARMTPKERGEMGARAKVAYHANFSFSTAMASTERVLEFAVAG